ncbi:MAG: hypothetical protein ACE5NJ_11430 [Thermodesulfobacteriota bacterium]
MRTKLFIFGASGLFFVSIAFLFGSLPEKRALIVARDTHFPPIGYLENDTPDGSKILNEEAGFLTIVGPSEEKIKAFDFPRQILVIRYFVLERNHGETLNQVRDVGVKIIDIPAGVFSRHLPKHDTKI